MRTATPNPEDLLPLTPAVCSILLALADSDKHGYAIMREVEAATDGGVRMGPGTLYGSIDRMLKASLIAESDVRPAESNDARRRYYRLTHFGRRVLLAETERLAAVVRLATAKQVFSFP
jgi:DNA-binding PadR family transcriptional regulator